MSWRAKWMVLEDLVPFLNRLDDQVAQSAKIVADSQSGVRGFLVIYQVGGLKGGHPI